MTAEQREKLIRWIDAYLDDRLSSQQKAQFEKLIERTPFIKKEIELQSRIDDSLRRLFDPPHAKAPGAGEDTTPSSGAAHDSDLEGRARPRRLISRRAWVLSAAACVLVLVGAGGYIGMMYLGDVTDPVGPGRLYTLAEAYRLAEAKDFKPDWACKNEQEFASSFHWQLGQAVAMATPPDTIVPTGLSYVRIQNSKAFNQVEVLAKVDGRGVIVLVDKLGDAKAQSARVEDGLHVFVKRTDHLLMREVTPFDAPRLLSLLSERDIPDAWKKAPPNYFGGRRSVSGPHNESVQGRKPNKKSETGQPTNSSPPNSGGSSNP